MRPDAENRSVGQKGIRALTVGPATMGVAGSVTVTGCTALATSSTDSASTPATTGS